MYRIFKILDGGYALIDESGAYSIDSIFLFH